MIAPEILLQEQTWRADGPLIAYRGAFSDPVVADLGRQLRTALEADTNESLIVFGACIELAQNIQRYSAERAPESGDGVGGLLAQPSAEGLFLASRNAVTPEIAEHLRPLLERLASSDADTLKELRRERRRAGPPPGSRGAGLGLIEAARRASGPLRYSFSTLRSDSSGASSLQFLLSLPFSFACKR